MKGDGLILWNAIAICEMSKTSWQMGKLRVKDVWENSTSFRERLRIPRTHSKVGTDREEWRFQQRTSRWTGSLNRQNRQMVLKPVPTSGRSMVTSSTVITMNFEFNSACPMEETNPIPLKYIDVVRSTHSDLDVLQEKRIDDDWIVDSNRSLSDSWNGFTKFTLLLENPTKGSMWFVGRLTKSQSTTRPDHVWPEVWRKTRMGTGDAESRHCSETERQTCEKKSGKTYGKHAKRKMERPMAPVMPWKKAPNMRKENWKDLWHPSCRVKELQMESRKCLQNRRLHPRRLQKRFMVEITRIHKATSGIFSAWKSWRSCCG